VGDNVIAGKRRAPLSATEKRYLRDALHTEAVLTGDSHTANVIRRKLGIGSTPEIPAP